MYIDWGFRCTFHGRLWGVLIFMSLSKYTEREGLGLEMSTTRFWFQRLERMLIHVDGCMEYIMRREIKYYGSDNSLFNGLLTSNELSRGINFRSLKLQFCLHGDEFPSPHRPLSSVHRQKLTP
jgi:hypothetical protein